MSRKKTIKTIKEYDFLVSILKNQELYGFEGSRHQKARLVRKSESFMLIDGSLYLFMENGNHKKVIPLDSQNIMTQEVMGLHMATHIGQTKMEEICNKLYFAIPRSVIRSIVGNCITCKQSQPLKIRNQGKHITANFPFERVQVDCIDLHMYSDSNDGYKWMMTIVDVYSKFSFVYKLKSKSSIEVKKCLEHLIKTEGAFKWLQTDNGLEFKNSNVDNLCNKYFIRRIYGRPRHPQSQGIVERFNQTITRYLQKQLFANSENNNKRWIDFLETAVYNYNISVHESTKKSPFLLFKRRDGFNTCFASSQDINDIDFSEDHLEGILNQNRYFETRFYDDKKENRGTFSIEDTVLVKKDFDNNSKTKKEKFESFYDGPYKIKEVLDDDILVLSSSEKNFKINSSRCKRI